MRYHQDRAFHLSRIWLLYIAVFLLCYKSLFGHSTEKNGPVIPRPATSVPKEYLLAYVPGVTKKGYQLGQASWCNQTGWLVVSLSQKNEGGNGETFPIGNFTPRSIIGYIALHIPSNRIRFLPNPNLTSDRCQFVPDQYLLLSEGSLYTCVETLVDSNAKSRTLYKWHLPSNVVSVVGGWTQPAFQFESVLKALEETEFTLDWSKDLDFKKIRRLNIRSHKDVGSIELILQDSQCDWPSLPHGEVFLPAEDRSDIINIRESSLCTSPVIRCLKLGNAISVKWEVDPKRITETIGQSKSLYRVGVPKGLKRPCTQIPLMIGNVLSGQIWFLDTATGELKNGWSHSSFVVPLAPSFGITSADGKLLALPNQSRFYLFQTDTREVLYHPNESEKYLQPIGIDKDRKVISVGDDGIWILSPPYKEPPNAVFRLWLPPGFE